MRWTLKDAFAYIAKEATESLQLSPRLAITYMLVKRQFQPFQNVLSEGVQLNYESVYLVDGGGGGGGRENPNTT